VLQVVCMRESGRNSLWDPSWNIGMHFVICQINGKWIRSFDNFLNLPRGFNERLRQSSQAGSLGRLGLVKLNVLLG
jgi:hypothetical protein